MPDDPPPRRGGMSRRRSRLPPWLIPDAPSQWWSAPAPPPRGRIVDPASDPDANRNPNPGPPAAPPPRDAAPVIIDAGRSDRPTPRRMLSPPSSLPADAEPSLLAQVRAWLHGAQAHRLASTTLARLAALSLLLVCLALIGQAVAHLPNLPWLHSASSSPAGARPTPTLPPTATSVPVQTELDGVITITNLDPQVPFEGDIPVTAHDGAWYCRNAPLPHSIWHVQLAGGQTISLPCIVPASMPSFLPPHTFRKVVPDAAGSGLALVDNPDSFRGVALVPTPTATSTR